MNLSLELGIDLDAPIFENTAEQKIHARSHKTTDARHHARRFASEMAIEETLPWEFAPGDCYHIISGGDIDALTYLRLIARQQTINYCTISTWCMDKADVDELEHLLNTGRVKRIDFYVGEIFKGTYSDVWIKLIDMLDRHGGRAAIFRNHSKVMAGFGDQFDFAIESSANINTNPSTENTVITIDPVLAKFYKDFFDGIKSFDNTFPDWKPYEPS